MTNEQLDELQNIRNAVDNLYSKTNMFCVLLYKVSIVSKGLIYQ